MAVPPPVRAVPPARPRRALRLLLPGAVLLTLSACAPRSCANPYVLSFLDQSDRHRDLSHVGLLRDPVVSAPGPTADRLECSVWEQVRVPGGGPTVLRPQYFSLRHVGDGWEVAP